MAIIKSMGGDFKNFMSQGKQVQRLYSFGEKIWEYGGDVPSMPDGTLQLTFQTSVGSNLVRLLSIKNGYDCTIDWGDGTSQQCPVNGGEVVHNYSVAKTVVISIYGRRFGMLGGKKDYDIGEITKISFAGNVNKFEVNNNITSLNSCLSNFKHLITISSELFRHCPKVISFSSIFSLSGRLAEIPATLFHSCTKAIDFSYCFLWIRGLTSIPPDLFKYCTEVTNFSQCFKWCENLTSIPIDLFDNCTEATSFFECFDDCHHVTGPVPPLWEMFPNADGTMCFWGCVNASNYDEIPANWK